MRRMLPWLAFSGLIFVLCLHWSWIDEPWDASFDGTNGGAYYGYAAQFYENRGFWATGGLPTLLWSDTDPDFLWPNVHHTLLPYAITYASFHFFGTDVGALRLPFLGFLIALVVFSFLAIPAGRWGPWRRAGVVLIIPSFPIVIHYLNMVEPTPMSAAAIAWVLWAWFRHDRKPRLSSGVHLFCASFLAGSLGWFSYGIFLGASFELLFASNRRRSLLRVGTLVGLPLGLALLAQMGWLFWLSHHLAMDANLSSAFLKLFTRGDPRPELSVYLTGVGTFLWRGFGALPLCLMLVGLAVALWRLWKQGREAVFERIACFGFISGMFPNVAFPGHAAMHDFWSLPAVAGISCLVVIGIDFLAAGLAQALSRWSSQAAVIKGMVATAVTFSVVATGTVAGIDSHASYATDVFQRRGDDINEIVGSKDLLLMPGPLSADRFYTHAPIIPGVKDRESFDGARKEMAALSQGIENVWILYPRNLIDSAAWVRDLPRLEWRVIKWGGTNGVLVKLDPIAWR